MNNNKVTLVGAGNIARALLAGLIRKGRQPSDIMACDPDAGQRASLAETGIATSASNQKGIRNAGTVILCVKPQHILNVCDEIAPYLTENQLLISVAAGVTTASMLDRLPPLTRLIRCMPNTPALVGEGMTVLYATAEVSPEQKQSAEELACAIGKTLWVSDEDMMDLVTALSGSGPAYFFLVMEAMEKAAVKLGMDLSTARLLTSQTALGAARMVIDGAGDPENLRVSVTSPGGTTQAAIEQLQIAGLSESFDKAITAARQRSIELSKS